MSSEEQKLLIKFSTSKTVSDRKFYLKQIRKFPQYCFDAIKMLRIDSKERELLLLSLITDNECSYNFLIQLKFAEQKERLYVLKNGLLKSLSFSLLYLTYDHCSNEERDIIFEKYSKSYNYAKSLMTCDKLTNEQKEYLYKQYVRNILKESWHDMFNYCKNLKWFLEKEVIEVLIEKANEMDSNFEYHKFNNYARNLSDLKKIIHHKEMAEKIDSILIAKKLAEV